MTEKTEEGKNRPIKSSISEHQKIGKELIPPLLQSNLVGGSWKFSSWVNNKLPEMLWACLVISIIPRQDALNIFKAIVTFFSEQYQNDDINKQPDVTHTALASLPDDIFFNFVKIITDHPLGHAALRPLLLLEVIPDIQRWRFILNTEVAPDAWVDLAQAVAITLNHRSQAATDIRWFIVLSKIKSGRISFASTLQARLHSILEYPNHAEHDSSASIRALEQGLRFNQESQPVDETAEDWPNAFWHECAQKTNCYVDDVPQPSLLEYNQHEIFEDVRLIQQELVQLFRKTIINTNVDARHDTIFGFALYSLALLIELFTGHNNQGLTGRLILKTLVDCRITLAYLLCKDEQELWSKFRCFGTGQAKLASLKLNELEGKKPSFINELTLEFLANEDIYEEFLAINIGQWCGLDLRKLAIESGTKEAYDNYYGWGSTFSHAHWSAMRDSCFITCQNPLHRLHRIPLLEHRIMEDALPDGIVLVNDILSDLAMIYPTFLNRVTLPTR
jgi:hypothetical protein